MKNQWKQWVLRAGLVGCLLVGQSAWAGEVMKLQPGGMSEVSTGIDYTEIILENKGPATSAEVVLHWEDVAGEVQSETFEFYEVGEMIFLSEVFDESTLTITNTSDTSWVAVEVEAP